MKNHILFIFITCSIAIQTKAQNNTEEAFPMEYFNEYWEPVAKKKDASYYRKIKKLKDGRYGVDVFYTSGKLQMKAYFSKVKPELVQHGQARWYYKNGNLKSEGFYENGERTGLFKNYHKNGRQKSEVIYRRGNKTELYCQVWDEDKRPLLTNGTGVYQYRVKGKHFQTNFLDSVINSAFFIQPHTSDTIYTTAEKPAEYEGGFPEFYRQLGDALKGKYPATARRQDIEGTVYLEFVIDKNGQIQDLHVLRGIGGGCDEAALAAFTKIKNWRAAVHNGMPVNFQYALPIMFKLQ